ncbi:response regulator [Halorarius litoreus]|uniref:response regulator n=1 Tax=Halorarius litoreus TaxID=2962676 RepID=UPI0020CE0684|nr:response regulator [Halorarius litoreus]
MGPANRVERGSDELSSAELFEILQSRPRRLALFHLRQHGRATIEELSEVVVALSSSDADTAVDEAATTADEEASGRPTDETQAYNLLRHRDLPVLEHYGLVSIQPDSGTVTVEQLPPSVAEWLDLATRQELRNERLATTEEADEASTDRLRVLVVDDDTDYLALTEAYLDDATFDVSTCENALDAFAYLDRGEFDCVISDYRMPSIDGIELLTEVRNSYPDLPFLLLTNEGNEAVASDAIRSGVSDYVVKGTDPQLLRELGDRVRDLVEPTDAVSNA